ncbi:MAG TPA: hypothetical protein VM689_11700 [Aliidongia sp.]|nr:hypothetical protein [Aliidongia sp.]
MSVILDGELILQSPAEHADAMSLAFGLRGAARLDDDDGRRFAVLIDALLEYERVNAIDLGIVWGTA